MRSNAKTPGAYLNGLPSDRRSAISAIRKAILKSLPKGYEEVIQYGMITYVVPLRLYPEGYLGDKKTPLPYASLASQKNHMAIYSMNVYANKKTEEWLRKEFKLKGKRLDMGKSCIRFKRLEDIPLETIRKLVSMTSTKKFIEMYTKGRKASKKGL